MTATGESINVVWFDLDTSPTVVDQLRALLNRRESEQASRYTSLIHQRRAIVRFGRRRQILGTHLDIDPKDIALTYSALGKPSVRRSAIDLSISSSQCEDVAVLSFVQHRSLGVDVESSSALGDADQFLDTVASEEEIRQVNTFPPPERGAAMLRLWTRKEAMLKATGQGIGEGTKHVTVPSQKDAMGLAFQPFGEGPSWLLYELTCPRPTLAAALVLSTDDEGPTPVVNMSHL
jgi:4'-phosphopantetheinyl transferase